MAINLLERLKNVWRVFSVNTKPTTAPDGYYSRRPDKVRLSFNNERTIINAVINRIAIDASVIDIHHTKLDENKQFLEYIDSSLERCLNLEANIDQSGRMFRHDLIMSLLDEGIVAVVPTDVNRNPYNTESYDILTMRVCKILEWYPKQIKVYIYNDNTGKKEELILDKNKVAIIENPFYSVMNEPNSILRRLIRKLAILDRIDEDLASDKLNLFIQNPYGAQSNLARERREKKLRELENEIENSKYGIGYLDNAEKIIQLNRPLDNGLLAEIEYLTKLFYSELGITQGIMDGSADTNTMNNYQHRVLFPIMKNICEEFKRKFLTQTAITQGQTIWYYVNPFDLLDINNTAELADKFTRNEILSSNEIRQGLGIMPSKDPKADMLINSNLNQSRLAEQDVYGNRNPNTEPKTGYDKQDESSVPQNILQMKVKDFIDSS